MQKIAVLIVSVLFVAIGIAVAATGFLSGIHPTRLFTGGAFIFAGVAAWISGSFYLKK